MISAKNISYRIEGKVLLENVSADFESGKLNLIIGPNGAGKSTFIKILSNQIKAKEGCVFYQEKSIQSYSMQQLARIRAVLSQNIEVAFPMSVAEVVMMGRYPHIIGKPTVKDDNICKDALSFFDISDLSDRNYMTLSGGEKQRVNFARVLAQIWFTSETGLRYLFLDEPLTYLDIRYQFEFMLKIQGLLKSGDLVVIGVVHDLNLAARFADKIILINNGKIMADGNKSQVLNVENISTAYGLVPVIHSQDETMNIFFK